MLGPAGPEVLPSPGPAGPWLAAVERVAGGRVGVGQSGPLAPCLADGGAERVPVVVGESSPAQTADDVAERVLVHRGQACRQAGSAREGT